MLLWHGTHRLQSFLGPYGVQHHGVADCRGEAERVERDAGEDPGVGVGRVGLVLAWRARQLALVQDPQEQGGILARVEQPVSSGTRI